MSTTPGTPGRSATSRSTRRQLFVPKTQGYTAATGVGKLSRAAAAAAIPNILSSTPENMQLLLDAIPNEGGVHVSPI